MVLCGFIILIHCNWLLFGFFVLYFALFGSVFHLLLDKCRMYVNIYHINFTKTFPGKHDVVTCIIVTIIKSLKRTGPSLGVGMTHMGLKILTWLFLFWNLMMSPRGHLLYIRWTDMTQGTHLFSSIWALPVQKTVKANPRGSWTINHFFLATNKMVRISGGKLYETLFLG